MASLDNVINTDAADEFVNIATSPGPPSGPDYVGGHFNLVIPTTGLQGALGSDFGIFNSLFGGTHDGSRQGAVYGNAAQGNFTLHSKQYLKDGTFNFHFDEYNGTDWKHLGFIPHFFGDVLAGHLGTPCLDPAWAK